MSGLYLTELANWLRTAGLRVVEQPGWPTRARSSGGFTGDRPWCVMWHHTASKTSIDNDAAYCATGDADAPICNLLIGRDGEVRVIAAGATNTNGKGYSMQFSRGAVPNDQMNTHAVGMEICNNGVGEVYPQAQIDAAFAASLCVCSHLGLWPDDVAEHAAWAPDRKIDPATATAVQGGWRPDAVNSSGTWDQNDLRAENLRRAGSLPPPLPPPIDPAPPLTKDDDSMIVALDENGTAWIGNGVDRFQPTEAVFNNYVVLGKSGCYRFVNTSGGTVSGWPDVRTVGADTIQALGREVPA